MCFKRYHETDWRPISSGKRAEQTAVDYLIRQGYEILARNWQGRYYEIDIIARYRRPRRGIPDLIVFFEVKYRRQSGQGYPEEFIDRKKIQKLRLGAESWMCLQPTGVQYELGAISLSGENFRVERLIVGL